MNQLSSKLKESSDVSCLTQEGVVVSPGTRNSQTSQTLSKRIKLEERL